jgi:hypothetical protein
MPLVILGLIVIAAVALLIYYSASGNREKAPERVRQRNYERSEDGKVVFLFRDKGSKGAGDGTDDSSGTSGDKDDN